MKDIGFVKDVWVSSQNQVTDYGTIELKVKIYNLHPKKWHSAEISTDLTVKQARKLRRLLKEAIEVHQKAMTEFEQDLIDEMSDYADKINQVKHGKS